MRLIYNEDRILKSGLNIEVLEISRIYLRSREFNEKLLDILLNEAMIISLDNFGGVNLIIEYSFEGGIRTFL